MQVHPDPDHMMMIVWEGDEVHAPRLPGSNLRGLAGLPRTTDAYWLPTFNVNDPP
ncbi:hypothetical protein AWB73_05787 [Caballeronia turbans]|jgi:hypothetical protein|nr:hypothetical protein AWB73_05787 [Caballeronia turbans]